MRRSALDDKGGIITERKTHKVTVRLRIPAGVVTPDQLHGIADIAARYHTGVALTVRQTAELSHVTPSSLPDLVRDLEANGTPLGSEKTEVVNVTACPGIDRCVFAQIDSLSLAKQIDAAYFGREMPVKTRIAISSCPFSCVGEQLNEIGVTGGVLPYRKPGDCTGCDTCTQYCKQGAILIKNGSLQMDMERCILCGMCIISCPHQIIHSDPLSYRISVGGRRGRNPVNGKHLITVKTPESVIRVVGLVVEWIYRRAYEGSSLQDQLDLLNFEQFQERVNTEISPEEIETRF